MKAITTILLLFLLQQLSFAGNGAGNDSLSTCTKFYNLHIVKNFPVLYSDTEVMQTMDIQEPEMGESLHIIAKSQPAPQNTGKTKTCKKSKNKTVYKSIF